MNKEPLEPCPIRTFSSRYVLVSCTSLVPPRVMLIPPGSVICEHIMVVSLDEVFKWQVDVQLPHNKIQVGGKCTAATRQKNIQDHATHAVHFWECMLNPLVHCGQHHRTEPNSTQQTLEMPWEAPKRSTPEGAGNQPSQCLGLCQQV